MPLPEPFFFSQNKLQDYLDCPRRFELRHILKQEWPAIHSEPIRELEQHIFLGNQFHLFIQQYFNGIDPTKILSQSSDPVLNAWWVSFENYAQSLNISKQYSEIQLSVQINQIRYIGIIDLLVLDSNGNIIIYDWKTNHKRPSSKHLLNRIQSKLYPLMVAKNQSRFGKEGILPENISMEYWFVNFPDQPIRFSYNKAQLEADEHYLSGLVNTITQSLSVEFPLTTDLTRCKFCNYRSLCARGEKAGVLDDLNDDIPDNENFFEINFDELSELEY